MTTVDAQKVAQQVEALAASLPPGCKFVALLFSPDGKALCVSPERLGTALGLVAAWVTARYEEIEEKLTKYSA